MNYSVIRHASTSLALPTQSDIMSPRASMGSNNREVILKFVLNNKWTSRHHIQSIDRAPSLDVIKKDIKFVGDRNVEGLPVVWNEAKIDLMARNALNQINSCIANFKDPLRHSFIDESEVIDVRDDEFLEHKNTNNVEHEEYVFIRSESGHILTGYYARFEIKGKTYYPWAANTTFTMVNAHFYDYEMRKIATIQQLKDEIGKQVKSKLPTGATVSSQELAKAAAFLWATYTDYERKIRKKDLSHSYTIISGEDEVLEHAQHQGYYSPNLDKNSTSIEQYPYQIGKCYLTRDGGRSNSDKTLMHVVLTNKNGKAGKIPDFVIALNKFNSAGEAVNSFLNTVKNAYPSYWRQAPNSVRAELIRQAVSLYYRNVVKPQHEGYYSPNLLSHSYTVISSGDELYHHGILGQKWGVRRFQNADGSLTSAGRERYGAGSGQKSGSKKGMVEMLIIPSIWAIQLSAILGPAAVSAVKESKREKKAEKELFGDDINCGLTMEDIKKTNPNFGKDGYNMNCPKCSTVVELRKRGMDVQAKSGSGQSMEEMCSWFKGSKFEEDVNKDYVKDKLTEMPKGASGFLAGNYKGMGGHVIHWTNIGDGKLRIEDGQCGKVFTWEQMEKKYNWAEDTYCYARLDNCEIDKDLMYKMGVFEEVKGDEKKK